MCFGVTREVKVVVSLGLIRGQYAGLLPLPPGSHSGAVLVSVIACCQRLHLAATRHRPLQALGQRELDKHGAHVAAKKHVDHVTD